VAAAAETSSSNSNVMTHILAQHDRLLRYAAEVAPTQDKTQRIIRLLSDDGRVYAGYRQSKHYRFFSLVLALLLLNTNYKHSVSTAQ
jgi:hypothetical protein